MPKLSLEEIEDCLEDRDTHREWKERKRKILNSNAEKKEIKKTDTVKKVEE